MIFYILISIVFISELIIISAVIIHLNKWRRTLRNYNDFLEEVKPKVKDIAIISRKLSEQFKEFAPIFAEQCRRIFTNIILDQLKNVLGALTCWLVKKEVEKHV